MASFHTRYSNIQGNQNHHSSVDKDTTMSEEPMTHFNSVTAFLPSCNADSFLQTIPGNPLKQNIADYNHHQKDSSSKLQALKKKHLTIIFDKGRIMRLLNSRNGSIVQRLDKKNSVLFKEHDNDEGLCTTSTANKEEAFGSREVYTVANEYSMYSSLHHSLKSSGHEEKEISQSPFISSIVHSWKYKHTNQVYAKKAIVELKEIVNEYHAWLQKTPKLSAEVAFIAPSLFLEWPKNWSFSAA